MSLFTIIIVSYNTKNEFIKTLNSVKRQTYKKYEVIIIDGYSNDGTIDLIKKIKDKRINFLIEKDNGIYDAMNKGIKKAKGEWTIFLNSGDVFKDINVSLVGRNLAILHKNVPHIDPETAFSDSNGEQGQEFGQLPSARSIGFNISLKL